MAHTDPIDDAALREIAAQIGERPTAAGVAGMNEGVNLDMGATMSVWMLGLDATSAPDKRFGSLLTRTGLWHHQVRHNGIATEFARSMPLGQQAADWELQEVSTSGIAEKIEEALAWVDKNVTGDPLVRLLVIPAFYLHALWLESGDSDGILVADRPEQYSTLQLGHLYGAEEFLAKLRRESAAGGIPTAQNE